MSIRENYDRIIFATGRSKKTGIYTLLEQKLSIDKIVGYHIEKGLHIAWRSKDIWLQWRDDGDTRTITELEIE